MATIRKYNGKLGTTYQVIIRRKNVSLSQTFRDKKSATRYALQTEFEIDNDIYIKKEKIKVIKKHREVTVQDVIDKYKQYKESTTKAIHSTHSWTVYYNVLSKKIGNKKANELTKSSLYALRDEIRDERNIAITSADRFIAFLKSAINHFNSVSDLSINNIVAEMKLKTAGNKRERRLTTDEMRFMLTNANDVLKNFLILALDTGARFSEILHIKKNNINFDEQTVKLDASDTKTKKSRTLPLTNAAINALKTFISLENKKDKPLLGFSYKIKAEWIKLKEKMAQAGFDTDLHLHDLRHEFTSKASASNFNSVEVASITGHGNLNELQTYAHLNAHQLTSKLEAISCLNFIE